VNRALEQSQAFIRGALDGLIATNPTIKDEMIHAWQADGSGTARTALSEVAGNRYERGEYRAAANSAVRALAFAHFADAELWQLLARIHATTGRFEVAATFLDSAERIAEGSNMFAATDEWLAGAPLDPARLEAGWKESIRVLRAHIERRESPKPISSVHYPPTQCFEEIQAVE
jgi:hypothetical protein